jgi:hypothetical protein
MPNLDVIFRRAQIFVTTFSHSTADRHSARAT